MLVKPFMGDLEQWMNLNLNNSVTWNRTLMWNAFWAVACHLLWSWRNKDVHEEGFIRPYNPVSHIIKCVTDYDTAVNNAAIVTGKEKVLSLIRWISPKAPFVKLNTDGAYRKNTIAGCGGIIRGNQGEWLRGFARCVGLCSAFVAELWGAFEGLRCARRMGFVNIEMELDSAAVVQVLKDRRVSSYSASALVKQIWQLLDLDWNVTISHTYREANKCADALANLGCSLSYDLIFYDTCPDSMSHLFAYDNLGIATPRVITV
jgi:ribonuclease HI